MSKVRNLAGGGVVYFCPGCDDVHQINSHRTGPQWTFNGNYEKPTFSPSVLYTTGHYVTGESGKTCWCTFEARYPEYKGRKNPKCYRCHSWVRDGMIQYLADSTHALAGRTVPVPEWPYEPGKYGGIAE
jgi:hypothetical protein